MSASFWLQSPISSPLLWWISTLNNYEIFTFIVSEFKIKTSALIVYVPVFAFKVYLINIWDIVLTLGPGCVCVSVCVCMCDGCDAGKSSVQHTHQICHPLHMQTVFRKIYKRVSLQKTLSLSQTKIGTVGKNEIKKSGKVSGFNNRTSIYHPCNHFTI